MMIAGGVSAAAHVEVVIFTLLGVVTCHIALTLLAHYIADNTLTTLKVITDGVGFVGCLPILEDWTSLDGTH